MSGRNESAGSDYRYGFNGMEKDDEVRDIKGTSYTTEFRQYDPRVGRWLSIDPKVTAWESPYISMADNPILKNDIKGDTAVTSNREEAQKVVDDLNALYQRTYGDELQGQDAFMVIETKYRKKVGSVDDWTGYEGGDAIWSEETYDGYAIVPIPGAGPPGFWDDDETGGFRSNLFDVLVSNDQFIVSFDETLKEGELGTAQYMGEVRLDPNLARTNDPDNRHPGNPLYDKEHTIAGVFIHEVLWHKSYFATNASKAAGVYQNHKVINEHYHLATSTQPSSHKGRNKIEPHYRDSKEYRQLIKEARKNMKRAKKTRSVGR